MNSTGQQKGRSFFTTTLPSFVDPKTTGLPRAPALETGKLPVPGTESRSASLSRERSQRRGFLKKGD